MKVLVDTSIWSLALRRKPDRLNAEQRMYVQLLTELIREMRVEIIGPIRQEVLSGVKQRDQFEKLRTAMAAFVDEPVTAEDYECAAECYNQCRTTGIECGPVGMLICAVALRRKWWIFTTDAGLRRCAEAIGVEHVSSKSPRPASRAQKT